MSEFLIDKIFNIVKPSLSTLGFNIVQVSFKQEGHRILEFLIERMDLTPITINDCSLVSNNISTLLDVEDIITDKYSLEVSSAGAERPLVTLSDYTRFVGYIISVKLNKPIDHCSKYKGKILKVVGKNIYLELNISKSMSIDSKRAARYKIGDVKSFTHTEIIIDFNLIKKANLVLTDEIFKKLLNKKN